MKQIDKSEVQVMKRSLSQRLARLNSTIASLVLATAGISNANIITINFGTTLESNILWVAAHLP